MWRKEDEGYFNVLKLHRDDVNGMRKHEQNKPELELTNEDMSYIAERLSDALMENFWISLDVIVSEMFDE